MFSRDLRRTYTIHITHDLRPRRLRPFSATLTHGIMSVGYPTDSVWRARTEEALIAKVEKWIAKDMLRSGQADEPIIKVCRD